MSRLRFSPSLFVVSSLLIAQPAIASGPFEILESDDRHVRIAFTLDDYRLEAVPIDGIDYHEIVSSALGEVPGEPGSPRLPAYMTQIALPPGARPVLTVLESDMTVEPGIRPVPIPYEEIIPAEETGGIATPVARLVPDVAAYAGRASVPAAVASLGRVGPLRNLSVVPLHVMPFGYRSGELVVARRIVVDVSFTGGDPDARLVPVRHDPGGERLYARNVLNAEQAQRWRYRKATPISRELRSRALRRGAGPEAKLRIEANRNELVRVTHARLAGAGWTITPPVEDLRLVTRDYHADSLDVGAVPFVETPIGMIVEDADGDGVFDGGDAFVFYARDAKTQRGWEAPEDRYSWENVYWVTASPGAGTAMPVRAWTPSGGTVAEPGSFESWRHYEEQNAYYWYTLDEEEFSALVDRRQKVDHLFTTHWSFGYDFSWGAPDQSIWRLPFDIRDRVPGTDLGVRVEWRGLFNTSDKRFSGAIYPGTGAGSGYVFTAPEIVVTGFRKATYDSNGLTVPGNVVVEGVNELVTQRHNVGSLALNWFEIGYERLFVAHDDRLLFTNGEATGRVRWTIDGFSSDDVVVLDLGDPDMPVRIDPELSGGGPISAVFEDDVATTGDYLAQTLSSVPTLEAAKIELDEPSNLADLLDPGTINADYLVVVYDDFEDALQPLVDHRASVGHTPLVARVSDVYDEFSGGLFRPEAIREFVRYCYRLHPGVGGVQPLHLLLVGDASEDYYGVVTDPSGNRTSAPTYVPTYMVIGTATDAGSSRPFIATDHWFIASPDGSGSESDVTSSMMVGRLPVGSVGETEAVVEKILRYEDDYETDTEQSWRRRGLMVADDCYSGGLDAGGGSGYRGSASEKLFETTSLRAIDTIHESGLEDFQVETFFLTDVLDSIPELERAGDCLGVPGCDWTCTRQYARNVLNLDGMFINGFANKGHLFVTYQGHGNRSLVSHEYVLVGNGTVGGSDWSPPDGNVEDVTRFTNIERWPIWFFFACHVAEFCRRDEARSTIGDCLAERLLFNPEAGSIASIASTGFEWLNDNRPVHEAVFQSWFTEPHLADATSGEPGILLGEIMFGAKQVLLNLPSPEVGMVESYITLGDPALRVDIAPPRFKVWQDQGESPWDDPSPPEPLTPNARIRAADANTPTTYFAARIYDEVPVEEGTIRIGIVAATGDTAWVDPADYTVTAGAPDPEGAVRSYTLGYTAPLIAEDFEIVFSATDYNERTIRLPLEARVEASFFAIDPDRPARPLSPGAFVATGSRVRAVLDTPVGLLAEEIELTVNGEPIEDVVAVPVDERAAERASTGLSTAGGGLRSFMWQVEGTLPASAVREGSNALGVSWLGGGESRRREIAVTTTARFALERYFAYPNPFESETEIFYRVSRAADRARLRIYTLTGRLIRTLEQASPTPDLNRIRWDGRDEEGDAVANGVYFFQLELVAPDGSKTTEQGKLARVVGHKAVAAPAP
jgi:hypothetical protein